MREALSRARVALFVCLAVAACGPSSSNPPGDGDGGIDSGGGIDAPQPHTLVGIAVTPTNPLLEVDLNVSGTTQAFVAMGQYLDGVPEDLTTQVTWAVANPAVGAMTGATLAIPPFTMATAEVSRITATLGTVVGEAQITVVAYRRSGPTQDFFFILPYQDPTGNAMRPLDFSTRIPALDVFFLMDTTGSMFGSITNLQSALSSTVVPGIRAEVADSQFGVGAYEDFPVLPFGSLHGSDCGRGGLSSPDQPFHLFQSVTADVTSVQAGVGMLRTATGPIGCGQDWPEGGIEALYQAATGDGLTGPAPTSVPANHTGVGGVAFRPDSMPVIVQISDAQHHGPGETGTCPTTGESANYTGTVAAVAHSRADQDGPRQHLWPSRGRRRDPADARRAVLEPGRPGGLRHLDRRARAPGRVGRGRPPRGLRGWPVLHRRQRRRPRAQRPGPVPGGVPRLARRQRPRRQHRDRHPHADAVRDVRRRERAPRRHHRRRRHPAAGHPHHRRLPPRDHADRVRAAAAAAGAAQPDLRRHRVPRRHARDPGVVQRRGVQRLRPGHVGGPDLPRQHPGPRRRLHAARSARGADPRAADADRDPVARRAADVACWRRPRDRRGRLRAWARSSA
ncbi:MAG: hypothetical protein IPL61_20505 [Myxococcales bacterium]|nr:hypothetical protein [Myxococcales bacterium]